jgi:hypothetical protein
MKRYDAHTPGCRPQYCGGCGELVESKHGEVVMYDDAAKLAEALEGLLTRHNDGSEEEKWAEWDTAQAALEDWRKA